MILISKRGVLPIDSDDYDREYLADEKPVIVVLKQGDMTVEGLKTVEEKGTVYSCNFIYLNVYLDWINNFILEETITPADLTKRIIFQRKLKYQKGETSEIIRQSTKNKKTKHAKLLLSFDNEDDQ